MVIDEQVRKKRRMGFEVCVIYCGKYSSIVLKFTVLSFVCVRGTWLVGSSFLEYSGGDWFRGQDIRGASQSYILSQFSRYWRVVNTFDILLKTSITALVLGY